MKKSLLIYVINKLLIKKVFALVREQHKKVEDLKVNIFAKYFFVKIQNKRTAKKKLIFGLFKCIL